MSVASSQAFVFRFTLPTTLLLLAACSTLDLRAATTVNTLSGNAAAVNDSLDGVNNLPDSFFGTNYNGYVGELTILLDSTFSSAINGTPTGMLRGDAGDVYAGRVGLYCYCVDSATNLLTSASPSQTYTLEATQIGAANSRYISAGVSGYLPGSLLRAAYLIDTFATTRHAGGDVDAAALQEAVWEVLYDTTPNLSQGQGNYFVRSSVNATALSVADLGNTMLASAAAANWGGASYNPTNVVVWMDPTNPMLNQSVISLYPPELAAANIAPVPEPASVAVALAGLAGVFALRRKK